MSGMNQSVQRINAVGSATSTQPVSGVGSSPQTKQKQPTDGLTFSKHLTERINRRGIDMSPEKLDRLSQAVDKAAEKGSRESVVLLDNLALLVSVSNRTVLTAIETGKMKDGVFTNIDSVVVG
jgi:flagellar operon protein